MNIFKELKRGNSREEEYFSAALAILLDEIPELTTYLLDEILGISDNRNEYKLVLEESFPIGNNNRRMDIVIESLNLKVSIENKILAPMDIPQLEDYSKHLETIQKETRLVFLSRDFEEDIPDCVDKHIFWWELYDGIELFSKSSSVDQVSNGGTNYLIQHFLKFLEGENMSIQRISEEYINGLKSFTNISKMIVRSLENLTNAGMIDKLKSYRSKTYYGNQFNSAENKGDFTAGIFYDIPDKIYFEITTDFEKDFNYECFEELENSPDGCPSYIYNLCENDFFSLSKEKQMDEISTFMLNSSKNADILINRCKNSN